MLDTGCFSVNVNLDVLLDVNIQSTTISGQTIMKTKLPQEIGPAWGGQITEHN